MGRLWDIKDGDSPQGYFELLAKNVLINPQDLRAMERAASARFEGEPFLPPKPEDYSWRLKYALESLVDPVHRRYLEVLATKVLVGPTCHPSALNLDFMSKVFPRATKWISVWTGKYQECNNLLPVEPGFVYVIKAIDENSRTRYVKIGKSTDPDRRLTEISPKMPFDCEIWRTYPSYFMSLGESYLHKKLAAYRVRGEWFRLEPEVERWLDCDARWYVLLGWFSHLYEELISLPEVALASALIPEITLDPYWMHWRLMSFIEAFEDEGFASYQPEGVL